MNGILIGQRAAFKNFHVRDEYLTKFYKRVSESMKDYLNYMFFAVEVKETKKECTGMFIKEQRVNE